MNYRHIYHAGNVCDVVKHAVLTLVLRHLRLKDKGFAVLDTHAGIGLYDLADTRALKTGEAEAGIKSLLSAPPLPQLEDYYTILRKLNPLWSGTGTENFRTYPGSPLIAFHMLRAQDRLMACELHPEDFDALRVLAPNGLLNRSGDSPSVQKQEFQHRGIADRRMQIHHRDGFEAMGAFLPPPEKRGLVLIDPPYEEPDEFDRLVKHIKAAHKAWPTGMYMVWYPIKNRPAIWNFHESLAVTGINKILCAEFIYEPEGRADKLVGSGLILINPPWNLDEELSTLFPALHQAMHMDYAGSVVKWLVE